MCADFGITRLANITGLDYIGIPVYQSIRPNARTLTISQGKGLTAEAAKVSALMESIEGWHAEVPSLPTYYELFSALASRAVVIDLDRLPRESHRTVSGDMLLPWVQGFDIARSELVWVPHEFVSLNRVTRPGYFPLFQNSSNGLASGNHPLEAIAHGLCEVIERDAKMLWLCDRSDPLGTATLVDATTIDDPACCHVLEKFREAGAAVAIQDITSDLGVPCYDVTIVDRPDSFRSLGYSWGQGCHLSREIALLRALTEAAQDRVGMIAGARDDITYDAYRKRRGGIDEMLLTIAQSKHPLDFRARPSIATDTFDGDIEVLMERLRSVGCDSVVVVDLTHETHRIPVVKVIVPGLEGLPPHTGLFIPGKRAQSKMASGARS